MTIILGDPGEILISDEEELSEVFENYDYDNPEQELNFDQDYHSEDGGHIYESIEDEVGPAADEAASPPPDDDFDPTDTDFDEELPLEFFENDSLGG